MTVSFMLPSLIYKIAVLLFVSKRDFQIQQITSQISKGQTNSILLPGGDADASEFSSDLSVKGFM